MKNLKKIFAALLCMLMLVSVFTGCAKSESTTAKTDESTAEQEAVTQDSKTSEASEEQITLKFMHWWSYLTEDIIQPFMDEHPNIKIDMEYVAPDQYADKIKLLSTSDELPDLFGAQAPYLAEFTAQNLTMDLTDALDTPAYNSDQTWRSTIQESLLENAKTLYSTEAAESGKDYGLPFGAVATAVVYNKTAFDEVGIQAPTSWDEFLSNNEKLKAAGYIPMSFVQGAGWGGWWIHLLSESIMPNYYAADFADGTIRYDSPEYTAVLSGLQELWNEGTFDPAGMTNGIEETQALFVQGKLAQFYTVAENFVTYLVDNAPDDVEVASYPMPAYQGEGAAKSMGGAANVLCLSAATKHKDAAIEFAKYLISETVFNMLADQGVVPSINVADNAAGAEENTIMSAFGEASGQGFVVPHAANDTTGKLDNTLTTEVLPALLLENADPAECAALMQKTYESVK